MQSGGRDRYIQPDSQHNMRSASYCFHSVCVRFVQASMFMTCLLTATIWWRSYADDLRANQVWESLKQKLYV